MPFLESLPNCEPEDQLCSWVEDETGLVWLAQASDWLVAKPLAIALLVLGALVLRWLLHRVIDRLAHRASEGVAGPLPKPRFGRRQPEQRLVSGAPGAARRVQRAQTMASLLKSISSSVIFGIVTIMAISELGYDVAPLIASAGILGLALGFGAQSLVTDFLSGIFMIIEDQYGVGDVVDLGEAVGTVEAVGLRVTRLRDIEGTVWYVRNGEILRVGNQSQNWARTVVDVPVPHEQDLHRVQRVLTEVAHGVWEDEDFKNLVLEEPEVWGVQEMTPDWITVRVTLKTAPLEQWGVAREMRQRIKARFDHEGIELARPTRVLVTKNGRSEPVETEAGAPEGSGTPA
jgi:moderate conductance mechanosensitive channel